MSQHELNLLLYAQVRQPIPAEHAFDADHQILAVRFNQPEKRHRIRSNVLMHQDLALLIHDAHVHPSGMQVLATLELMLILVESHFWLLVKGVAKSKGHNEYQSDRDGPAKLLRVRAFAVQRL